MAALETGDDIRMNDVRLPLPGKAWLCLTALSALLQGCATQAAWNGIFATDLAGGAKTCVAPSAALTDGQRVAAQVQVSNEGGWCGITVTRNGAAFDSYLLVGRPLHGHVFAHRVGGKTRIDYTPDRGFTGVDSFAVHLIPGDSILQGAVTVTR